jgi:hypothetical protein
MDRPASFMPLPRIAWYRRVWPGNKAAMPSLVFGRFLYRCATPRPMPVCVGDYRISVLAELFIRVR